MKFDWENGYQYGAKRKRTRLLCEPINTTPSEPVKDTQSSPAAGRVQPVRRQGVERQRATRSTCNVNEEDVLKDVNKTNR